MSEIVFPHTRARARLRVRLALLALLAGALFAAFSARVGLTFIGVMGGDVVATTRVVSLGDSLGVNSNVKFRGLRVGRVVAVDSTRDADGLYAATVVIDEGFAADIPSGVQGRVLPGTLFGAEFIDLREPAGAVRRVAMGGTGIADGAVIQADTSRATVRLMDTFSALYRVVDAIDPGALDMAVSQLASALQGRGASLGKAVGRVSALVDDLSDAEPTFYRDLGYLTTNLDTLAEIEPTVADALRDVIPVALTIVRKKEAARALLVSGAELSRHVDAFLAGHGATLRSLLRDVAPTYRAFVQNAGTFAAILAAAPHVLDNGARAVRDGAIQMAAIFSGQHLGPYSSADCPRYGALRGRNCP